MRKTLARTTLGTMAAFALTLVMASAGEAQVPQQQGAPDTDVAQEELVTFAEIYLDVDDVRADLEQEMQSAQNPEEAQQMQAEANEEMMDIVQDHGMSVERYTEITQALNADPELYEEFQQIVAELDG